VRYHSYWQPNGDTGRTMKAIRRFLSRLNALLTRNQQERRLAEEFDEHIARLTEDNIASGLSPAEARRQAVLRFGPVEVMKDLYRDRRGLPRLDALVSDAVFGWRQLRKHPTASAAAVLSLALSIGAATAAFRLVDAVLLRTLPVAEPERLFYLATTFIDREGRSDYREEFDYPTFRRYCQVVGNRGDAMVVGMVARLDVTFAGAEASERLYRQYVSGNLFAVFGLQPVLGRLLTPADDLSPGAHPVAVLSYDYWTRRFGRDPGAIGKTFRFGNNRFEIVGVAPKAFIGTEPGEVTDVFIPAMMNVQAIDSPGWSWFRIWVRPKPGISPEQVRQPLQAAFIHEHRERLREFHSDTPSQIIDAFLNEKVLLLPAAAGSSRLQKQYRRPLLILGLLVALVLLVACVNVANLLTAQAAARAREMALRVSIGAGRWRLVQLVLLQSAWLATAASTLGALFASWAAPLVTSMLRVPGDPVRLVLRTGWRELAFSVALASLVTLLFGLAPALRASAVHPVAALKGTDDAHSRRRVMNALVSAQVAFCVLVLFVAGLFISTFQRLTNRPLGFSPERVLVMDVAAVQEQPPETWMQIGNRLRDMPGIQSVSSALWPLLSENRWTGAVRLPGRSVEPRQPYFLGISPAFFETMRIALLSGRDFRSGDLPPRLHAPAQALPGVGIVNEAFARTYLNGENPVGRSVYVRQSKDLAASMEIIGYVRDAAYRNLREPIAPTVYVPIGQRGHMTFLLRTTGDPLALAPAIRREALRSRPDFRVHTIQTQNDFVRWHLVRERLLAALSLFFAIVALVLAAIGLYGILNYSVTRQKREIGIRMALGARAIHVLRGVTTDIAAMICVGSAAGVAGGLLIGRFIEALLFEVRATDPGMLVVPVITLAGVAFLAGVPPAMRAAHIDPSETLRSD
jgi:putative ABC transport system permease protein